MANVYRNRIVPAAALVFQTVDLFDVDGYTKVNGVVPAGLVFTLRFNGSSLAWPLVDGSSVTNPQISSGSVYWSEPTPGNYVVRFFPNAAGTWDLELRYATVPQQVSIAVDVVPSLSPTPSAGIFPSFTP